MNVTWISCSLLPSLVSSSSFLSHADSRGYRSVSLFLLFLWHNLDSPGIYLFNEVNQGRERERRKIMKRNQDPINRFIASLHLSPGISLVSGFFFLICISWDEKLMARKKTHDWLTSDLSFFSFYPMWP